MCEPRRVVVDVRGGVASIAFKSVGVAVQIRDYDIQDSDATHTDEHGEKYSSTMYGEGPWGWLGREEGHELCSHCDGTGWGREGSDSLGRCNVCGGRGYHKPGTGGV